ncbi:hypothetical protein AB9F39_37025, partial [Rhizobium leguminosarum]
MVSLNNFGDIEDHVARSSIKDIQFMLAAYAVKVGDLGDLEQLAADADILVTHSHGRQAAERLAVPL